MIVIRRTRENGGSPFVALNANIEPFRELQSRHRGFDALFHNSSILVSHSDFGFLERPYTANFFPHCPDLSMAEIVPHPHIYAYQLVSTQRRTALPSVGSEDAIADVRPDFCLSTIRSLVQHLDYVGRGRTST